MTVTMLPVVIPAGGSVHPPAPPQQTSGMYGASRYGEEEYAGSQRGPFFVAHGFTAGVTVRAAGPSPTVTVTISSGGAQPFGARTGLLRGGGALRSGTGATVANVTVTGVTPGIIVGVGAASANVAVAGVNPGLEIDLAPTAANVAVAGVDPTVTILNNLNPTAANVAVDGRGASSNLAPTANPFISNVTVSGVDPSLISISSTAGTADVEIAANGLSQITPTTTGTADVAIDAFDVSGSADVGTEVPTVTVDAVDPSIESDTVLLSADVEIAAGAPSVTLSSNSVANVSVTATTGIPSIFVTTSPANVTVSAGLAINATHVQGVATITLTYAMATIVNT
jgi:hypothetical protein